MLNPAHWRVRCQHCWACTVFECVQFSGKILCLCKALHTQEPCGLWPIPAPPANHRPHMYRSEQFVYCTNPTDQPTNHTARPCIVVPSHKSPRIHVGRRSQAAPGRLSFLNILSSHEGRLRAQAPHGTLCGRPATIKPEAKTCCSTHQQTASGGLRVLGGTETPRKQNK